MTLLGSVDIPFTKSTKIAVDATDTAGQAATVAQQATDTAGQAQATAQTASQTATQAAATAADAAQAAQTAIATANGKNKAYYGATTPTSPKSGDIWFVEDSSGNVTAIKHYDGTQWITDVDNTALEQQISAAQAAADNAATVGQAAQQTAADAEAKGDAAAKVAEEAKDAATKAQADAASAVTSANNAVNTANKATQDAQDAIDKAQNGFDAAQDALSKAGAAVDTANTAKQVAFDATDTANTAKQVASDAATQASTAKTNAQTAMSNAQDAINKANAANANANTREKSIVKSNTAPSNPATDQLWIDTSKTPQIMRRWNGSAWVDLSPTQASQIGAVSTTTYTTDITNINNTLSQKASVTTVNTLSGRVDEAETAITQNANAIASKADKTVVDTLKNTVDNHSTLISQNANAIEQKANASTVDTLTGRVSTAEATLKTQANEIAARITKTDADAKYATQTALTATADSLTSSISTVQTNLDNLQVGGRNLIKNSDFSSEMEYWSPHLGTNGTSRILTNKFQGHNAIHISVTSGEANITQLIDNIEPSTYYTFSGNIGGAVKIFFVEKKSDGNNTSTYIDNYHYYPAQNYEELTPRISFTFKTQPDTAKLMMIFRVEKKETEPSTSGRGTLLKLEKGNKPTDWSPAPEDMATVAQFNTLSQTLDSTTSRIGNAEGNISALQQTANSFATRISNAEGNISTLTQTAQGLQSAISGKVDATTYNSFVTQTNSALQSKLSVTDAANKYATQSQLTQTASSLTSKITSVQTNLDNLQVGGRNLAPFDKWQVWSGAPISKGSNTITLTSDGTTYYGIYHYEDSKYEPNTDYILTFKASLISGSISRMGGHSGMFDDSPSITKVYVDGNLVTGAYWNRGITISPSVGATHTFEVHLRTKGDYSGETKGMFIQPNRGNFGSAYSIKFWDLKIEKGNKATDWTPAPEDLATQSQISQLSDDINLRVQKGDVINQINVSTEGILIDGKKVHITGQTTIDNAVIKDAMIQSVTANKLTAGTIDANVITVKNINASNIVTGTLDASKATVANIDASKITTGTLNAARIAAGSIDASKLNVTSLSAISANLGNVTAGNISGVNINIGNGNFTVDTAGNLVAKNANITGTINATSGTFSGSVNVISTVTNPWGNYDTVKINPTYRFPIHIDDDESRHTYLSSGIVEIYYPGFSDTNTTSAKTTIEPSLITFSENDKTVSQITANAIYSIDYYNGQSTITSNGNAQFGNINLNGYHSIISNDGDALFFTNANGDRININAKWVMPNNMALGYHTIASLDGEKLFFTNNTSNGNRIDIGIATLDYSGSLSKSSSETLKSNIEPISFSAINEIMKTDFYSYNYISDLERGVTKPNFGPVIGDSYRLSDKFLTQDEKSISIDSMTAINSQAIKELYESMQKQNQQIVLKIADLEARLAKLEA